MSDATYCMYEGGQVGRGCLLLYKYKSKKNLNNNLDLNVFMYKKINKNVFL